MDEFHRFGDLPEPLRAAIFLAAWRNPTESSYWRGYPRLRLVCRLARATIDAAVENVRVRAMSEQSMPGVDACIHAVGAGRFPALREWRVELESTQPAVGTLTALAQAMPSSLQTLILLGTNIDQPAVAALSAAAAMPALRKLDFCSSLMDAACLSTLAQGFGPSLEILDLRGNPLGPEGAAVLAAARLSALRELDLGDTNLGDAGVEALTNQTWPALESLSLDENGITSQGTATLATAAVARLPLLHKLSISDNKCGDAGVQALTQVTWGALQVLHLNCNTITHQGVAALAAEVPLPVLRVLHLAGNDFDDAGVEALVKHSWPHLQELNLNGNCIGLDGGAALGAAASRCFPALRTLSLVHNYLGYAAPDNDPGYPQGVHALVHAAPWPALRSLDLGSNYIDEGGVKALLRVLRAKMPALRELNLRGNLRLDALEFSSWPHLQVLT